MVDYEPLIRRILELYPKSKVVHYNSSVAVDLEPSKVPRLFLELLTHRGVCEAYLWMHKAPTRDMLIDRMSRHLGYPVIPVNRVPRNSLQLVVPRTMSVYRIPCTHVVDFLKRFRCEIEGVCE